MNRFLLVSAMVIFASASCTKETYADWPDIGSYSEHEAADTCGYDTDCMRARYNLYLVARDYGIDPQENVVKCVSRLFMDHVLTTEQLTVDNFSVKDHTFIFNYLSDCLVELHP